MAARSQTPRLICSTGSFYPLDTAEAFALVAEAECDGVEVMCDARWSTRDPVYLRELRDRYQLPILVLHTPFSAPLPGWEQAADAVGRIKRTLALAEELGAERIVVHLPSRIVWGRLDLPPVQLRLPWPAPSAPLRRWFTHDLPALQADTALQISIENLPGRLIAGLRIDPAYWNTAAAWAQVHQWLTLDTTHWGTFGIDPTAAHHLARGRVCHVHLSNYDGREHRLPDRGRLDLARLLQELVADDFTGTVSLELHADALGFPDRAAMRQQLHESVAFCRRHLGQVAHPQADHNANYT